VIGRGKPSLGRARNDARLHPFTRRESHLCAEAADEEVEVVDVAEADDCHHALAREQGVEEGARLAQVQVLELVVRVKLWGQRKCCNIYTWENAADTRACVMMLAPAIPKPTRRRPVCGDEQTEAKTDRQPPLPSPLYPQETHE